MTYEELYDAVYLGWLPGPGVQAGQAARPRVLVVML